ncbi:UNVERIFIED_CONTAM: hypothetical protein Scaly_0474900 [Sesamum calycinum]|uniref:Myb/SANT-like domain-containing protein n=1 Tax=Sesamum calycinum TaxID=2727403 RepID=A0AAW2SFK2_9LAMI
MKLYDEEGISKARSCRAKAKKGYLQQLEVLMCKQFPNTDIRAEPHMNSKVHVWKKYYGTLLGMMGKSGLGWDDTRCMIDPSARSMRYKSWSYFPAWCEIFGKDQENGEVTHDVNETENLSDNVTEIELVDCYVPTAEWCPDLGYVGNDNAFFGDNQANVEANVNSTASNKKCMSSTKNRKPHQDAQDDGLATAVFTFCETTNKRLGEWSKKYFVDYDEVSIRSTIFKAVGRVPGIDMNDQILISDRLVDNPKKMDLFFRLPDEARACMVGLMLNGKY